MNTPLTMSNGRRRSVRSVTLLTTAALALTIGLGACGRDEAGGGAEGQGEAIEEGAAEGTIEVWAMGTEGDELGDFAAAFADDNPDATVEVTAIPWEAAHDKIANAIASGETPDVTLLGTTWMGEFAESGGIEPTPEGLVDEADFFEGAWGSTEVGGTSLRRAVVRRDARPLLPHRPGREGGLGRGAAELGRPEAVRHGPAGQGRRRVRHQPPRRRHRLVADLHAVRLVQRRHADQRRRHGVHDGLPGDDRGAGVLQAPSSTRASPRPRCSTPVSWRAASRTARSAPSSPARGTPAWSRTQASAPTSTPSSRCPARTARPAPRSPVAATWPCSATPTTRTAPGSSSSGSASPRPSRPSTTRSATCRRSSPRGRPASSPTTRSSRSSAQQLESALAPPAVPTWEEVATAVDSEIEKATKGQIDPAEAVSAMQKQAESIGTGL